MKMHKIESGKELPLGKKLIRTEVIHDGPLLKRVTFHFEGDTTVEFSIHGYNELSCLVPTPPEMVDKWRVSGKVPGHELARISALFDRESDAREYGEANLDKDAMKIEHIKLPKEEAEDMQHGEIPF